MLEHKERRAYRTVTEFYEDEEITLRHSLDYLISMINEAYGVDINPNDYTFVDADTLEHLSDLPATFNIFQPEYSFCFFSRPTDELTL